MNTSQILDLLRLVAEGGASPENALERLKALPFEDLGFAKVDHHRHLRKGYPETIFCEGKTPDQIVTIANRRREHGSTVLGTRCKPEGMEAVLAGCPGAVRHEAARAFTITVAPPPPLDGHGTGHHGQGGDSRGPGPQPLKRAEHDGDGWVDREQKCQSGQCVDTQADEEDRLTADTVGQASHRVLRQHAGGKEGGHHQPSHEDRPAHVADVDGKHGDDRRRPEPLQEDGDGQCADELH